MRISRMITAVGTAIAATLLTGVAAPAQASPQAVVPTSWDGPFRIVNIKSDKCLAVSAGRTDNGAPVIQWTCNGGAEQDWYYSSNWTGPAGWTYLLNRKSGKCLADPAGSLLKNKQLIIWPCNGGTEQAWHDATDYFQNDRSGMYMSVAAGSVGNGARVIQWPYTGGAEQMWYEEG